MGLLGRTFQVVGVLFLLIVGLSAYLYFIDYGVEGTITGKGEDTEGPYIILTTQLGEFDIRHHVPAPEWDLIQTGHHVIYQIQTGTVLVYESEADAAQGRDPIYRSQ